MELNRICSLSSSTNYKSE
ncbi:hypothetical protein TNIN_131391, partial [Trichonephila inaurata madagascariensis]